MNHWNNTNTLSRAPSVSRSALVWPLGSEEWRMRSLWVSHLFAFCQSSCPSPMQLPSGCTRVRCLPHSVHVECVIGRSRPGSAKGVHQPVSSVTAWGGQSSRQEALLTHCCFLLGGHFGSVWMQKGRKGEVRHTILHRNTAKAPKAPYLKIQRKYLCLSQRDLQERGWGGGGSDTHTDTHQAALSHV